MNCRAIFLEYYQSISEFSQIDIKFLLGEFDSAQEPEKITVDFVSQRPCAQN